MNLCMKGANTKQKPCLAFTLHFPLLQGKEKASSQKVAVTHAHSPRCPSGRLELLRTTYSAYWCMLAIFRQSQDNKHQDVVNIS